MKEKAGTLLLAVGILLLGSAFLKRAELEQAVYTVGTAKEQTVVVIDAGHGGTWYRPKESIFRSAIILRMIAPLKVKDIKTFRGAFALSGVN